MCKPKINIKLCLTNYCGWCQIMVFNIAPNRAIDVLLQILIMDSTGNIIYEKWCVGYAHIWNWTFLAEKQGHVKSLCFVSKVCLRIRCYGVVIIYMKIRQMYIKCINWIEQCVNRLCEIYYFLYCFLAKIDNCIN